MRYKFEDALEYEAGRLEREGLTYMPYMKTEHALDSILLAAEYCKAQWYPDAEELAVIPSINEYLEFVGVVLRRRAEARVSWIKNVKVRKLLERGSDNQEATDYCARIWIDTIERDHKYVMRRRDPALWRPNIAAALRAGIQRLRRLERGIRTQIEDAYSSELDQGHWDSRGRRKGESHEPERSSEDRTLPVRKSETVGGAEEGGVFLSHNSKDKPFVRRLARDLGRHGVPTWFDELEILPGDSLVEKIQEGISNMRYLGVVLSSNSVGSSWVKKEVNVALVEGLAKKRVVVVPMLISSCAVPPILRDIKYADFRTSYAKGLENLLRRLEG